jgi:2-methylcitrate dehydratase PrpD
MVSGSRLKPGALAAGYVRSLGGKADATVVGARFRTSGVNAALANAMAAQADETDDTDPIGPVHLGAVCLPAALAAGELAGRSGADVLRAVIMGYDVGARLVAAMGINEFSKRLSPACMHGSVTAGAVAAALLRLNPRQVRHTLSYAVQQSSGIGIWKRDQAHIEKSFDFAGMGARNGVMAATMVAYGFTAGEDPFSGDPSAFSGLGETPSPEKLVAGLGREFAVTQTTIKKWSVGAPLQSVADGMADLLKDRAVRPDNIRRVIVEAPAYSLATIDNARTPDLCAQHLVALMIVDEGASFASLHDAARMKDPKILAVRSLVTLKASTELDAAKPPRQSIVSIETKDGRSLTKRTVYVRGVQQNPMTKAEVETKALDLMAPVLGAARTKALIKSIDHIEALGPISRLRPLLQA